MNNDYLFDINIVSCVENNFCILTDRAIQFLKFLIIQTMILHSCYEGDILPLPSMMIHVEVE